MKYRPTVANSRQQAVVLLHNHFVETGKADPDSLIMHFGSVYGNEEAKIEVGNASDKDILGSYSFETKDTNGSFEIDVVPAKVIPEFPL